MAPALSYSAGTRVSWAAMVIATATHYCLQLIWWRFNLKLMFVFCVIAAGQERFRSITKSYYRNSVGVLLVYDITNHASFEHIPLWMMEAKRHIEPHRPVFALIGCKLDLLSGGARRQVSVEEAKSFAEQHSLYFIETSSRTGVNVREAFQAVTQEIYNRIQSGEYKIEDGWDGIKAGFPRPSSLDFNYVMAEPAKSSCC